jgi:orotidine-5'-phosphate decarboxylase
LAENFADRVIAAIQQKGTPLCVGIDPVYSRLPADINEQPEMNDATSAEASLDAVLEFSRRIIRIVAPLVPAVKINSAFFERFYSEGLEGYFDMVQEAAERELIVIGDVKRGDVGHSAEKYARSALADPDFDDMDDRVGPDAVTVNAWFGLDGVRPFIDVARSEQKGVFALVRTSNESAAAIQRLVTTEGTTVADEMARHVAEWAVDEGLVGERGYSCIGAVVSTRDPEEAARLRAILDKCILLIPGYGAQGMTGADVAPLFKSDGTGALVNASRSIIYAYEDMKYIERFTSEWDRCVEQACKDTIADLAQYVTIQR